jgi:hypothetical protein
MKDRSESKNESTSVERGVLTDVAQKVGTAVGTVVSALSRTSAQGSKKTMAGSNSSHSPLKRRRRKSKSAK